MRLIDADALFEALKGEEEYLDGEGLESRADGIRDAIMDVISAPTIEQVNVTIDEDLLARAIEHRRKSETRKKGKWIKLDYTQAWEYKCDQCGRLSDFEENYCPSCGSDMRPEYEEPEINPCRGCADYDGRGGCKSDGGCGADMKGEQP